MLNKKTFTLLFSIYTLFLSSVAFAVDYTYLAPIPTESGGQSITININENTLETYFKNIYRMGIALAIGLAVLMIVLGGIEYITTDAIGGKEEGKEKISNAIMGLLLALGSFLILRTIDPNLVNVSFNIKEVDQSKIKELTQNAGNFEFPDNDTEGVLRGNESPVIGSGSQAPIVDNTELQQYLNHGKYQYIRPGSVHNDAEHTGYHSPYIEYIWHYVENNFRPFKTNNTYRSPNHAQSQKNSNSDHIVGQAIDFYAPGYSVSDPTFISRGNAIVEWARQNGQSLGIDQIIFREKNYRWNGSTFVNGDPVSGHYDHVHIGRIRDGSENWGPRN